MPSGIANVKVPVASKVDVVIAEQRGEDSIDTSIIQQPAETTDMRGSTENCHEPGHVWHYRRYTLTWDADR